MNEPKAWPYPWPEPTFLQCECYSDEHTIKFDLSDDPDFPELYASVFLIPIRNIFKRVWRAIKYVFGYRCMYGYWDCFLMRPQDIGRMKALLDKFQEAVNASGQDR